jgi:tetratricopeptide (TPR) repeat protein
VSDDRFTVVPLAEIDGLFQPDQPGWHMVRSTLGITAFGINAWQATEAGQNVIAEHDEVSGGAGEHEEVYVVVSGRATFTVEGERLEAPSGTVLFVRDPTVKRGAVAEEADTVVLVVGGRPGEAFSVSPWEKASEALRFWTSGDWDKAIEMLERQLADDPENATLTYNLACAESRGGRLDAAIEHLTRAVELRPAFAESAPTDPDLEAIRGRPGFPNA